MRGGLMEEQKLPPCNNYENPFRESVNSNLYQGGQQQQMLAVG